MKCKEEVLERIVRRIKKRLEELETDKNGLIEIVQLYMYLLKIEETTLNLEKAHWERIKRLRSISLEEKKSYDVWTLFFVFLKNINLEH